MATTQRSYQHTAAIVSPRLPRVRTINHTWEDSQKCFVKHIPTACRIPADGKAKTRSNRPPSVAERIGSGPVTERSSSGSVSGLASSFIARTERDHCCFPRRTAIPPPSPSKAAVALCPPSLWGQSAAAAASLGGRAPSPLCHRTKRQRPHVLLHRKEGVRPLLIPSAAAIPPPHCRRAKWQWP